MRKLLLNSTAIATVAALTSGAAVADVSISAATEWSYNSRSSQVTAHDGTKFGTVGEMTFKFSNKTDSGLTIGYVVEVESDDKDTAINESSLSIEGGFGKVVLGGNDGVDDNFGVVAKDLIAEEATPVPGLSTSIGASSDIDVVLGDANKISYFLPAMGGLTVGASFADSGEQAGTDTTAFGANYTIAAGDATINIGGATNTTEVSGGADKDSQNLGVKVVSGSMSFTISQSDTTSANDDIQNQGAAVSYKLANGMVIGAYTFKSEDDLDINEEYVSSGVELQYTVAAGLTAVLNVDDYEYTAATTNVAGEIQNITQADSGTNSKLTLKASF